MSDLTCPVGGRKLPYANAKMNSDKSVKVWKRVCRSCGLVVTDTAIFSREISIPGKMGVCPQGGADMMPG